MDIFNPEVPQQAIDGLQWKIDRDPFYSPLFQQYGIEFIKAAGFIYDTSKDSLDLNEAAELDCTPIYEVDVNFNKNKLYNPCIILSTGSFCPLHTGHIEMMYKAKEACESNGYTVIAGYMAPDHDEYVSVKNGSSSIPVHERIAIMNDMLEEHRWISVDPWAGVFGRVALNFTDIYERLSIYIKNKFDRDIPIFFVCGSDNNRLALTFIQRGNCVIVSRPGFDGRQLGTYTFLLRRAMEEKRILYIEHNNVLSSTVLRKMGVKRRKKKELYYIRTTGDDPRENDAQWLFLSRFPKVRELKLAEQKKNFDMIQAPIISIDSLLPAKYNLPISRGFDKFGIKFLRFCMRPDGVPLSMPDDHNSYFLFDDDIHSGGTMSHASGMMLKMGMPLAGVISLTRSQSHEEIVDARDFYYGTENCGLVVYDGSGQFIRVPYAYPFADPYVRASVSDPMTFSIEVWELNMRYFDGRDEVKYGECKKYYDLLNRLK